MKNIHILSTDKPSRLVKIYNDVNRKTFKLKLDVEVNDSFKEYVNIYITYDEEIKEGDCVIIQQVNLFPKPIVEYHIGFQTVKKIILTTDSDLIADGVQAIDDEFLEWFVKNPNCDFVRTLKVPYFDESGHSYLLIIPKEEHKQETQGYICPQTKKQCDDECCVSASDCHLEASMGVLSEPKKETLEEAAEKFYPPKTTDLICSPKLVRDSFIAGAKWQQEQNKNLYSEEESIQKIIDYVDFQFNTNGELDHEIKKWFEQFSKLKNG